MMERRDGGRANVVSHTSFKRDIFSSCRIDSGKRWISKFFRTETRSLLTFAAIFLTTGLSSIATVSPGQAPSIVTQPQTVTTDYGNDISFSVTASGAEPLTYQWYKSGLPMADFDNVAGSALPVLHLVGVAENDATNYFVVVANQSGSLTSSVVSLNIRPTMEFSDNFEGGLTNWRPLFDSTAMTLDTNQNHTAGGSWSLLATNASQKMYCNFPVKYSCRVSFTFWMYDDGSSLSGCGQLRGYTGPGYGNYASPGGMKQELIIGKYNAPFSTNGTQGSLQGQILQTNWYQARVLNGANAGWFNLNASGAPSRSVGWHKFRIDRSSDNSSTGVVNFYVDDILSGSVSGINGKAVNCIVLGSINSGGQTSGNVWFDDIKLDANPDVSDWQTLDSTGRDLFPDWMKLREVGTNSEVINATVTSVLTVNGSATNDGLGSWAVDQDGIYATGLRGYLDYTVNVSGNDAYRIEVEGREKSYQMPPVDMPLIVSIDGELLGRFNLTYGATSNGFVHCFTPYIQAGSHVIRVYWDNVSLYRKLYLQAVRLQSVSGGIVNPNGMKAWVANRLAAQCGVDYAPETSLVSPVCVEGRGQYLSMMSLSAGEAGFPLPPMRVRPGAGNHWYANVPLSPTNTTVIVASFQNGAFNQTNETVWQACNLLNASNVVIRKQDSLLFTLAPDGVTNGSMTISITGAGSVTSDISTPVPYQFDNPGNYTVTGTYLANGASGSINVQVVDASFEEQTVPARMNKARYWDCTNLPPGVVFMDPDPRLKLVPVSDNERSQQTPALPSKGANEQEFRVRITSAENPQYVLARLGQGGPVLASAAIQGFRWSIAPDTYLRIVDHNNDGSQLIETAFVASPLMASLNIQTQIIVSGVTFGDGTTVKNLAATDFDNTGVVKVQFIRNADVKASVCHTTYLYDGTNMISWR